MLRSMLLVLAVLVVSGSAMAVAIPVVNGSFETQVLADGVYARGVPDGWSGTGYHWTDNPAGNGVGSGDFLFSTAVPDGQNVLFITPSPYLLEIENDVHTTFVEGTTYNIKVSMARDTDFAYNGTSYDFRAYWVLDSGPWGQVGSNITHNEVAATSSWQDLTLSYTVGAGQGGAGYFQILIGNGAAWGAGNAYVYFDNLRVDAVPEPMTMAFLGLGAFLIRRKG